MNTLKKVFCISKPKWYSLYPLLIATLSLGIALLFWTVPANAHESLKIITDIYSPCYSTDPVYGSFYCGSKTNTRYEHDFDNTPDCDHCTEGCSSCQLSVPHFGWNHVDNVPIHFKHSKQIIKKRLVIYRKELTCVDCWFGIVN